MIVPLRRRHVLMISVLTLAIPVVLVIAIAARPIWPAGGLPTDLASSGHADGHAKRTPIQFASQALVVARITDALGNERIVFEEPTKTIAALGGVDPLVYWRPARAGADAADAGSLNDQDILLGDVSGDRLALPAAARSRAGSLVIYDLARQSVIDVAPLPASTSANSTATEGAAR